MPLRKAAIIGCLFLHTSAGWAAGRTPVVAELFESQGCSSCPPSERTVEKLAREFGDSVVLLIFHVDYWDYLGWKDTFSDKRFTDRQTVYGRAFGQDSIYTPEMVVQGQEGFNGSDLGHARQAVRERLEQSPSAVEMTLSSQNNKIRLSVHLTPELVKHAKTIEAVIYENSDPVKVLRGENAGGTMSGLFAVRDLQRINMEGGRGQAELTLKAGWNPSQVSVAVLVRGEGTALLSAQTAPWPNP